MRDHRPERAHSPFVLLATADADGRCDVSPDDVPSGVTPRA
ncbi:pyridoxamine 5'-phosphate oxidase family protein [Herbidospora solisilvae]|nr:pyridoxamine 5'-phosphate oxidase family protein [Herbidospora solisilvae]